MFSISLQINSDCVLQYYLKTIIERRKKTISKASITYTELTQILPWKPICENQHDLFWLFLCSRMMTNISYILLDRDFVYSYSMVAFCRLHIGFEIIFVLCGQGHTSLRPHDLGTYFSFLVFSFLLLCHQIPKLSTTNANFPTNVPLSLFIPTSIGFSSLGMRRVSPLDWSTRF